MRNHKKLTCKHCNSSTMHRSRRRSLEYLVSLLGVRPYRCSGCDRRSYIRGTHPYAQGHTSVLKA